MARPTATGVRPARHTFQRTCLLTTGKLKSRIPAKGLTIHPRRRGKHFSASMAIRSTEALKFVIELIFADVGNGNLLPAQLGQKLAAVHSGQPRRFAK